MLLNFLFLLMLPLPRSTLFPYTTLFRSVPEKIDIVNVFRRPEFVDEIVDEAIQLKVPAIWMQESVINDSCIQIDRKSTRLNSSHRCISYAVFCLKKKK